MLDVRELDRREVVGLDRPLEARVELLDLVEHALRLGALRSNRVSGCGNSSRREQCCDRDDQCRRLSSGRARGGRFARQAPSCEGPVRHKHGTLTTQPDGRKWPRCVN